MHSNKPVRGVAPDRKSEAKRRIRGVSYPVRPEHIGNREIRCRNDQCQQLFIADATLEFIRAQGPPFLCFNCGMSTAIDATEEA